MSGLQLAIPRLPVADTPVNPKYNPGRLVAPGTVPRKVKGGGLVLPASVPLAGNTAHGAVFGGTGSGKSTALRVITANMLAEVHKRNLYDRFKLIYLDGKMTGAGKFVRFQRAVTRIETDPQRIARVLLDCEADANARFRDIDQAGDTLAAGLEDGFAWVPPSQLVIILDELIFWLGLLPPKPPKPAAAFETALANWRAGREPLPDDLELDAETMIRSLTRGMMAARAAAMNYILAMQAPQANQGVATFPVSLRENLGWRLGIGVGRDGDRELAYGDADIGKGVPVDEPGQGVLAIRKSDMWCSVRIPDLPDLADPFETRARRELGRRALPPIDQSKRDAWQRETGQLIASNGSAS